MKKDCFFLPSVRATDRDGESFWANRKLYERKWRTWKKVVLFVYSPDLFLGRKESAPKLAVCPALALRDVIGPWKDQKKLGKSVISP